MASRSSGAGMVPLPRPSQGNRGEHRLDRAVDQGRDRERPDDGGRRDPDHLRRHRRQPRALVGERRRRRDRRGRGHAARRRAGARRGPGDPCRRRPPDPPRPAARVHGRQPGRHPRSDRHGRSSSRGEGQPRHRGDELCPERHSLRRALRPDGRRRCLAAPCQCRSGPERRRKGDRRRGRRHRRRHDGPSALRRRRNRAHERHSRRREQHHERRRRRPSNADGRGGSPQATFGLRARAHGRPTTKRSRCRAWAVMRREKPPAAFSATSSSHASRRSSRSSESASKTLE